ncbi:MAG: hypothetical protein BGO68_03200 [Candidatus Amoebophilus sp. 36-38]|nr:MAG: hypothetical protein BGO68_03200 [Candidatus Amoebophilus sp. 36-38]
MTTIAQVIEKRGEKRGEERGEKKGVQKNKLTVAKNMLKKGYDISSIQEITELPKGTIEGLKKGI